MTYDFTSIMERHGQDAVAVDGLGAPGAPEAPQEGFDAIPMWVADMNFPVLPAIQDAIVARVKEPHFGYFDPRDEYFERIIAWQRDRNGVTGLFRSIVYRIRERRARRSRLHAPGFRGAGRCSALAQPYVYRVYQKHRERWLQDCLIAAQARRLGCLAHGFR